jgi:hypothetical protein
MSIGVTSLKSDKRNCVDENIEQPQFGVETTRRRERLEGLVQSVRE